MAEINIKDLINIIESHPDYYNKWYKDVPASQALYIQFHNININSLESTCFTNFDGSELVVDLDSNNIVYGIEIV